MPRSCTKCEIEKPDDQFSPGHRACRKCRAAIEAERRLTMPQRASALWHDAKRRATKRGLDFDLTVSWILWHLRRKRCGLTGQEFVYTAGNPRAPSIDRKNPSKGYTKKNCRVIVIHANVAMGVWMEWELENLSLRFLQLKRPDLFTGQIETLLRQPQECPSAERTFAEKPRCSKPAAGRRRLTARGGAQRRRGGSSRQRVRQTPAARSAPKQQRRQAGSRARAKRAR